MMSFESTRHVDWGDCDAAGIVFYPNYFRWMDSVFHEMTRSLGFDQNSLPGFGIHATPLIDVGAQFHAPVSHGNELVVTACITRLGRSGFTVRYRFSTTDQRVAEGHENRVCITSDDQGRLSKIDIPDGIRALLERHYEG
ncbi:MAG: thioesterase family protein [Pseudomonadota bacterium]